jgi:hypothetical protein
LSGATTRQARRADRAHPRRLARYDAGEIDVFDVDDVIHHYKRAARELWKFCVGSGAHELVAARTPKYLETEGELPDWWEVGAPRQRR